MEVEGGATLAEVGEDGALARIRTLLPDGEATVVPSGDDAAVIAAPDGRFVVTTDVLVEGHHFRTDWSSGYDVGWRAAMQNLADVAAMGARPTGIVVALTVPPATLLSWLEDFARGLAGACTPVGCGVVGGDLSGGETISAAVTAFGDLEGRAPVLRSGARAGDELALAGSLGRSAAGLALLSAASSRPPTAWNELIDTYVRPDPPLREGPRAADAGAHAMMDVSDGLLRDAGRMAAQSRVTIDIDPAALAPWATDLAEAASAIGHDPLEWVLTGGEDHPLLAAFAAGCVPEGWSVIGRVLPAGPSPLLLDGTEPPAFRGFDHFHGDCTFCGV